MTVRKIGQSWWVDFRAERVRYRKRSPENTRAGARAFEVTLRQRLARGESVNHASANLHSSLNSRLNGSRNTLNRGIGMWITGVPAKLMPQSGVEPSPISNYVPET